MKLHDGTAGDPDAVTVTVGDCHLVPARRRGLFD